MNTMQERRQRLAMHMPDENLLELQPAALVEMLRDQEKEFNKIIGMLTEIYGGPGRAYRVQVDDLTHAEVTIRGDAPLHVVVDATIAALQGVYLKIRPSPQKLTP